MQFIVHTSRMIILYILLIAYVLAINFYAYLLVKSFREKEQEQKIKDDIERLASTTPTTTPITERTMGKLCITGLLGGAITIYVCMFALKYKRSDMLLMILMPLLGVLNIYIFVLLFRSGFSFLMIR